MTHKILDVKVNPLSKKQAILSFSKLFHKKTPSIVTTVNMEFINLAQKDQQFKTILNNRSSLNLIDGVGVIWANFLINSWKPQVKFIDKLYVVFQWLFSFIFIPFIVRRESKKGIDKISGSDFIWDIAKYSSKNNLSIFILGYSKGLDPNISEKASLVMQTKVYKLKVAGSCAGTDSIADEKRLVNTIKKSHADILLVGFGAPKQEKWLARNLKKSGCKVGIGLGGTFDFIAQIQKRAPKFIQNLGLEWLYRIFQNPRRIPRQLSLLKIVFKVLRVRLSS